MSVLDKVKHSAERVYGGIKEKTGAALNDPKIETRGRAVRLAAKAKMLGHTVVERLKGIGRNVRGKENKSERNK